MNRSSFIIIFCIIFLFAIYGGLQLKSNPPLEQWGLRNIGQNIIDKKGIHGFDIGIEKVWKHTLGKKDIIVGIIDSGIELNNDYYSDSIFINEKEIENNNIDDDGNGYIDDYHGWNFYDDNNVIYSDILTDYHGTMIASIIGASHNNDKYWGIAPNVTILPLKAFAGTNGDLNDVIQAIEYANKMNVNIINMSWDTEINNEELFRIMKKYSDILFIVAAGKNMNNINQSPVYPASYNLDNMLTIAAVNNQGNMYYMSNYGESIDVFAPGEDIYVLLPENSEMFASGTSFAVAHVTGIASLLLSIRPEMSAYELKTTIVKSYLESNEVNNSAIKIINAELLVKNIKEE